MQQSVIHVKHHKSSAVAEMGDRGDNRHGPKSGKTAMTLSGGGSGTPSNTTSPGARFTSFYHRTKWYLDPSSRLATIDIGRKLGGAVPFLMGGAESPSNTKSLRPRPTNIPSGILIHPAVWPQRTWAENWGLSPLGEGSWVPVLV